MAIDLWDGDNNFPNKKYPNNSGNNTVYGKNCLLYTSPSPRDMRRSRMPSSA